MSERDDSSGKEGIRTPAGGRRYEVSEEAGDSEREMIAEAERKEHSDQFRELSYVVGVCVWVPKI